MKSFLFCFLVIFVQAAGAQSLDYLSVRKSNGRVIKNFYTGSTVLLQLTNSRYVEGPLASVRNDSVYVTLYDVRAYRTNWGAVVLDTVSTATLGLPFTEISRVHLDRKNGFFQRLAPPLLKVGSAGYLALNLLNGNLFDPSFTDGKNLKKTGFAAGTFGLGFLLGRWLATDGFNKKNQRLVYVNLSH